jgi:glycosyltransferase involved in cell wall biosynthesis
LPAEKIVVKPNFVDPDPGPGDGRGGYAIFVGRLSVEKGIETLLSAWHQAPLGMTLKIVGDGPLAPLVQTATQQNSRIEWLGQVSRGEVQSLVADGAVLVLPSICYEGLPKTIIEAFASGTPVVGSRLGGIAATVAHGRTGRLFAPGDAATLAAEIERMATNPAELAAMRAAARKEFESKYTRERNYEMLMEIYHQVGAAGGPQKSAAAVPSEHASYETPCEVAL